MSESQREPRTVCRRTVVAAVGGAGLTVALTACGSDDAPSGSGEQGAGGTGASTGGTSGGTSGGSSGGGKVLAKVADIPEGGGKVVGDVVITQPVKGEFKAFSAQCTHQGCAVRSVADNVIVCPCHDSRFDASDGSVKAGPAPRPLSPTAVRQEGDSIVLA
ncbi:Rieske (2Fe-2S) protein [Streptomyces qinzhouensis]|uniref:Cytochrome bc1 complex Rieske iron-sulfur subunit n=1 Tax=Streptomyces qinzhouensis TaxID=2599401 RepID=A0A5B8J1X1_9ACTN|nr:Rieske (2Fe-2S) protein [Streptomyces qinzhouensis]QDY75755.1 Rieske (2Fe-2S) protein [Streptomyces qinzhouensis]